MIEFWSIFKNEYRYRYRSIVATKSIGIGIDSIDTDTDTIDIVSYSLVRGYRYGIGLSEGMDIIGRHRRFRGNIAK